MVISLFLSLFLKLGAILGAVLIARHNRACCTWDGERIKATIGGALLGILLFVWADLSTAIGAVLFAGAVVCVYGFTLALCRRRDLKAVEETPSPTPVAEVKP